MLCLESPLNSLLRVTKQRIRSGLNVSIAIHFQRSPAREFRTTAQGVYCLSPRAGAQAQGVKAGAERWLSVVASPCAVGDTV